MLFVDGECGKQFSNSPKKFCSVFKRCEHLNTACLGAAKVTYFAKFGADTRVLKKPAT